MEPFNAQVQETEKVIQLLVPVYNEGENVRILHKELLSAGGNYDRLTFLYDFDEDTTLPVIRDLANEDKRVVAEKNTTGRGVVNALKHGFSRVEDGPVIVLMGDNSDKLSIIPEMIRLWEQGASIVSPSRYMKGGKQYGGGLVKSSMSRLAGVSLNLLGFPTADPTNNFKLYDGHWLRLQTIESVGGFEIALELCCKAYQQGQRIVELPTVWRDREDGESRFQIVKWLPHYLKWYFKCVLALVTRFFPKSLSHR